MCAIFGKEFVSDGNESTNYLVSTRSKGMLDSVYFWQILRNQLKIGTQKRGG
jgi:hypothetical protein